MHPAQKNINKYLKNKNILNKTCKLKKNNYI
jgi:hypothetical protein